MRRRRPHVDLDGAVVVITGGSSGIGKATALRLASRGSRLVLAARGVPALERTADECRALGARAVAVPTDVSDEAAVAELARRAEEAFGRIDAWINGAGVMVYGTYDEAPMATHRQVVETNLLGPMFGCMEALRRFRRQGGRGVIVNVASLYADMTSPLVSSYVTSKFGLLGFSRVLRRDLYGEGDVAVCCILPASFDTPIFRNAGNHHGRVARAIPPVSDPDRVARRIVRCLEHPRKELRIGTVGHSWRRVSSSPRRSTTGSSARCSSSSPSPTRTSRRTTATCSSRHATGSASTAAGETPPPAERRRSPPSPPCSYSLAAQRVDEADHP